MKGRSGEIPVTLEPNEYLQAGNHPDRYWLYVIYNCETLPTLRRIPDPYNNLVSRQTGVVRILVSEIKKFDPV